MVSVSSSTSLTENLFKTNLWAEQTSNGRTGPFSRLASKRLPMKSAVNDEEAIHKCH
jgi:hypothetical protein